MQSRYRGDRERRAHIERKQQAVKMQRHYRGFAGRRKARDKFETDTAAALNLQRVHRGGVARQRVRTLQREAMLEEARRAEHAALLARSATRIQASYRGLSDRESRTELRCRPVQHVETS